jgi:putative transcriptional regulator
VIRYKLKQLIAEKEFRERRRITVLEVADATGISRMTLSKMINHHGANLMVEHLDKLCDYFACGLGDLAEYVKAEASDSSAESGALPGTVRTQPGHDVDTTRRTRKKASR